ncbi:uncharacterized protein LOC134262476 [Saccostrea cucullata]|uniref:uncharacterized protein LOC134262476 n=1 Tax=Saccostrea cuccullata TaxID=36930 RepID=UPI002ED01212
MEKAMKLSRIQNIFFSCEKDFLTIIINCGLCLFFFKGGKVYITHAIVILANVFSMMTVNWTKMIYNEEESKSMLFGVLLCSITIGIISISFVLLSVLRGESNGNRTRQADSFSEKVKNKAGVGFGLLNFSSIGILFANFSFWLDTIFFRLFMNVVYHMFYLFTIWKGSKMEKDDTLVTFLGIPYFENILSIFLAGEQTVFILSIENSKKMNENKYKSKIYFICVLLSLSNFGIWGGDSFGEAKLPALSFIVEKYYSQTFWIICTKLILPFTIFFRIHSALMFLKMYGKRKANNQTNPSLNTIPKTASSD